MNGPLSPSSFSSRGVRALPHVAIIGGGAIGLGIGWRLAQAGCAVDVFDCSEPGHGATWAAAGMLAAALEAEPGEERLLTLNRASQALWPDFARELGQATGIELGYRDEGTLLAAFTRDAVEELRFAYEFQRALGLQLDWLEGREALRREPHLHPSLLAAVYSAEDHQVDNRCLARALVRAFVAAGGRLHAQARVDAVEITSGRVTGLRLAETSHPADIVLLAAGAWSRQIEGLPDALRPPVRPVKGQMLALQMDPQAPLLRHVLWAPKAYLVPRRDGRLIIGATVEERGFDARMTAGAVFSLLEAAWRALPAIEELPIVEMWAGFRPGSRDDAPILGGCAIEGLVFATGHHRNGILLTPITVAAVSRLILTGECDPAIRPFGLDRFIAPRSRYPSERLEAR